MVPADMDGPVGGAAYGLLAAGGTGPDMASGLVMAAGADTMPAPTREDTAGGSFQRRSAAFLRKSSAVMAGAAAAWGAAASGAGTAGTCIWG